MVTYLIKFKCEMCGTNFETLKSHLHNRLSCPGCGNDNEEKMTMKYEHNTKKHKRSKR